MGASTSDCVQRWACHQALYTATVLHVCSWGRPGFCRQPQPGFAAAAVALTPRQLVVRDRAQECMIGTAGARSAARAGMCASSHGSLRTGRHRGKGRVCAAFMWSAKPGTPAAVAALLSPCMRLRNPGAGLAARFALHAARGFDRPLAPQQSPPNALEIHVIALVILVCSPAAGSGRLGRQGRLGASWCREPGGHGAPVRLQKARTPPFSFAITHMML